MDYFFPVFMSVFALNMSVQFAEGYALKKLLSFPFLFSIPIGSKLIPLKRRFTFRNEEKVDGEMGSFKFIDDQILVRDNNPYGRKNKATVIAVVKPADDPKYLKATYRLPLLGMLVSLLTLIVLYYLFFHHFFDVDKPPVFIYIVMVFSFGVYIFNIRSGIKRMEKVLEEVEAAVNQTAASATTYNSLV